MKHFFIYIICLLPSILISEFSGAQNYTISPSNSITVTAPENEYSIFDIFMNNTSSGKISLSWKVISNQLVPGWDYSMCDMGTCYVIIPNQATMKDSVDVGEKGFLGLNVNPLSIPGTGKYIMYVYETGDPANGDTLTWIINTTFTGLAEMSPEISIRLYPNPAAHVLNVSYPASFKAERVEIWNTAGSKLIEQNNSATDNSIDISFLTTGLYIAVFVNENGIASYKKFIKSN